MPSRFHPSSWIFAIKPPVNPVPNATTSFNWKSVFAGIVASIPETFNTSSLYDDFNLIVLPIAVFQSPKYFSAVLLQPKRYWALSMWHKNRQEGGIENVEKRRLSKKKHLFPL
jgi:hypothetical protein